jgi:hypothetical protein
MSLVVVRGLAREHLDGSFHDEVVDSPEHHPSGCHSDDSDR